MFNPVQFQFKFQQTTTNWSHIDEHFNKHLDNVGHDLGDEELNKPENLDEKDEEPPVEDEPKVFQDEEVIDEVTSDPVLLKKPETHYVKKPVTSKLTSVMPTPLAYSRSSSMTSLNSFDVKSIHSTVESEYSHMPKKNGDNSQLDIDDDLDNLMPDSPSAPDSSFLKAQRTLHKINQAECRQNAWKISNDLNTIMSKLVLNEPIKIPDQNTPPVKLTQVPKFLQSNPPPPPVMSVTYGFLKNSNPLPPPLPQVAPPKFLMGNYIEDSPKVYASVRLKPDSPQESVCSRMSEASLPSLINHDLGNTTQKFNSILNANPNFKALFDKLNTQKVESCSSSSGSSSSCSSVIPKLTEEPEDEEEEEESFLNTTTKPMNTPAGFASVSGASFIEDNNENTSLNLDFDLENFIKENFQPSTDLDENNKKFSKRASLQSLDVNLKPKSKQVNPKDKKRLSEDNLKVPVNLVKKTENLRGSRTNSASVANTVAKPAAKVSAPVVNMTKTAQLRASKLNHKSKVNEKIIDKKSTTTTAATTKPINRPIFGKQSDRFNTTVNENTDVKSNTTVSTSAASARRFSIGPSLINKMNIGSIKKPVLSNVNKDLNQTVRVQAQVKSSFIKSEPVKPTTLMTTGSRGSTTMTTDRKSVV